jgi:hypothetical protein
LGTTAAEQLAFLPKVEQEVLFEERGNNIGDIPI